MRKIVVEGTALAKSYLDGREKRQVLETVDLCVARGTVVGLQGPSGCGKSTLLNILAGLIRPDAGVVSLAGQLLDYRKPREVSKLRRAHVGLLSQDYALLESETVQDNIALPLMFGTDRPPRRQREQLIGAAIDAAALEVHPRRRVSALSGGERQRVAIARALVRGPALLIADEPTAALDATTAETVVASLRSIADGGAGVLLATHDARVAAACDELYEFVNGGLITSQGSR